MLSKVKKGGKDKKQAKKEKKPSQQPPKKQTNELTLEQEQQSTDLVDIDYTQKQQKNKAKAAPKKKNKSELEESQIPVTNKLLEKKTQQVVKTSWVVNTVDEALGRKFDVNDHSEEFESLTNTEINKKIKQEAQVKKKQQKTVVSETGLSFAPLQKSADQLAMERAQKKNNLTLDINETKQTNSAIKFNTGAPKMFTNSAATATINTVQIEKTPQQIKMQEAENKQQEMVLKKKNQGWLGSRKDEVQKQQFVKPKVNPWVTAAQKDLKTGVNFAPLKPSEQELKFTKPSGRQQQQFVFVSKAQQQERRKKREQKEKLQQQGLSKV